MNEYVCVSVSLNNSNVGSTMCMFSILFTFDHWADVLRHIVKKTPENDHPYWTVLLILWILFAAILTSNLILAIVGTATGQKQKLQHL